MSGPFRFGVNLLSGESGGAWRTKCRRAEQLGYDVLLVPDHLHAPAPFSALAAAAAVTERPRLGTFVLNAGLWNPALLAREVATCDALTDGRLEVGLGAGYVKAEHDSAELPFGSPGERVDHLERTVAALERPPGELGLNPPPAQTPRPPLLIGGNGDRVLRLAARHADTMAFTGAVQDPEGPQGALRLIPPDALEERVTTFRRFVRESAADGERPVELNYLVQQVRLTPDRRAGVREVAELAPYLTEEQLLEHPALLVGTATEIAEQLRTARERFGFSYITVLDPFLESFGPVIEELSGD